MDGYVVRHEQRLRLEIPNKSVGSSCMYAHVRVLTCRKRSNERSNRDLFPFIKSLCLVLSATN